MLVVYRSPFTLSFIPSLHASDEQYPQQIGDAMMDSRGLGEDYLPSTVEVGGRVQMARSANVFSGSPYTDSIDQAIPPFGVECESVV